jgi:hypothetical protein
MKILPNPKVCLLLDKLISDAKPANYNDYSKADFLASMPYTNTDTHHGANHGFLNICALSNKYLQAAKTILGAKQITNTAIYPCNSIMGWHTNSDLPGTRIYYTKTDGEAIFSYIRDGVRIDDYDTVGAWTCRQFELSSEALLWHSIWTEKHRYAFGFLL